MDEEMPQIDHCPGDAKQRDLMNAERSYDLFVPDPSKSFPESTPLSDQPNVSA